VGTVDEITASFGQDFFRPASERATNHNWLELCTCGHTDRHHSPSIGGSFVIPEDTVTVIRGQAVTETTRFHGCNGALAVRGFEKTTVAINRETGVQTTTVVVTCPCTQFRPVAKVDRPNRYWNQRMPATRDRERHPFMVGCRAFLTFLGRRRRALSDPDWAAAEFDRRFMWLDGQRHCSISKCRSTDDVWPVFVNDDRLSELRCPAHR
jgi:hypothetical protein